MICQNEIIKSHSNELEKEIEIVPNNSMNEIKTESERQISTDIIKIRKEKIRQRNIEYRKTHKEQIREYNRLYAKKHSEENKTWYKLNKEIVNKQHKEYSYRSSHKRNVRRTWLYKNNVSYRLRHILRARFHGFLKLKNLKKQMSVIKLVGCSGEQLQKHLESKFKNGMTWENYGKFGWHIDHIIPLSSTTSREDMEHLCHYTNLQPLWWYENISKGNKYNE